LLEHHFASWPTACIPQAHMHNKRDRFVTHFLATVLLAVLTIIVLPNRARGQAISGDLVGTVVDATGAGVPNATVTARNTGTNVSTPPATTNDSGQYRISNLPAGTYDIQVSAPGFTASSVRNIQITLNSTATANVTLQVGGVSSSVNVIEAPVVIDTTTAQIQNTFTTTQTQDLPTASIGLGVLNLSLLNAGVTSSGGVGIGAGPSVGGQRPAQQ